MQEKEFGEAWRAEKNVAALRRNKWARVFDVFNREHDKRAERCGILDRERDKWKASGVVADRQLGSKKRTGRKRVGSVDQSGRWHVEKR